MNPRLQIKGIKDGLLISLISASWNEMHADLIKELDQNADFLRGANLTIDVGEVDLKAAELGQLTREISDRGLSIVAVLSKSQITKQSAQSFGLATQFQKNGLSQKAVTVDLHRQNEEDAILVRRTLRSGVNLQYPGHVILIGDVNPGAQIIAGGDVVVWGKLLGVVHAGAQGNEDAVICALDLSPTQLRIAGSIAVTPKRRGKPLPETAQLENGQVIAQAWNPKKEKK